MHAQNMGANCLRTKFCMMIKGKLGLTEKSLTAHFVRRSEVIALADVGILIPDFKQTGRWASTSAVEEYMEHSHAFKKEHLALLDTTKRKVA
eukprot:8649845-Ditylum_brightwellii.AAC.1